MSQIPVADNILRDPKEQDETIDFGLKADNQDTALWEAQQILDKYPMLGNGYCELIEVKFTTIASWGE